MLMDIIIHTTYNNLAPALTVHQVPINKMKNEHWLKKNKIQTVFSMALLLWLYLSIVYFLWSHTYDTKGTMPIHNTLSNLIF